LRLLFTSKFYEPIKLIYRTNQTEKTYWLYVAILAMHMGFDPSL